MRKIQKTLIVFFFLVGLVGISWATQVLLSTNLDSVTQVMQLIQKYYYESTPVNYDKMQNDAIDAVVKDLNSRFTYYIPPNQAKEFSIQTTSKYGGIGTEVTYNSTKSAIEIISPMYGSPAERAGLKSGDLITTIDGSSVKSMGYLPAVDALRGNPGSKVDLQVYRPSDKATMNFTVTRAVIELKTVKSTTFEASGVKIGYIRITNFSETTAKDFDAALSSLMGQNIQALVLDLRDDPGGLFTAALNVSSQFLPVGQVIVTIRDKNGAEQPYRSYGGNFKKIPIVILVNHGSASSSEIVSAALRDHKMAVLVGERTYGKAAVQTEFQLKNGGYLLLVTNHYFTPNGQDINLKGIEPDYVVSESGNATQTYQESYKQLVESVVSSTQSTATIDIAKDVQLQKAVEILVSESKAGITFPKDLK